MGNKHTKGTKNIMPKYQYNIISKFEEYLYLFQLSQWIKTCVVQG